MADSPAQERSGASSGGAAAGRLAPPVEAVRYGDHPAQVCDLHLPADGGAGRVAALVHGGFWKAGYDRTLEDAVAADLLARGWAVWNVDHRAVGDADDVVPAPLSASLVEAARVSGDDDAELVVVPGEGDGERLDPASAVGGPWRCPSWSAWCPGGPTSSGSPTSRAASGAAGRAQRARYP